MLNNPKYITLNHLRTAISALLNKIDTKPDETELSTVAFTGDYNELINKPYLGNYVNQETFVSAVEYVDDSYMKIGRDYVTAGQLSGSTLGQYATAEGDGVTASGAAAHAEGYETTVTANYGHAEGYKTTSEWEASHAEGRQTFALGDSSHTEGQYTIDFSSGHVEGNGGINGSSGGHVEGIQSLVSSVYLTGPTNDGGTIYTVNSYGDIPSYLLSDSSRLSYNSTVLIADPETGEYSSRYDVINCSVSNNNLTSLTFSKTLGSLTNEPIELSIPNTLGYGAHVEGNFTEAYGNGAHAEGNTNIATGNGAHVEGQGNQALNLYTHAEGTNTTANGEASHAEGTGTIALDEAQHASGKYNIPVAGAEVIGGGTSNANRANIRVLDWSGNETLAGTLTIGGANGWTLSVDNSGNLTMLPASNS